MSTSSARRGVVEVLGAAVLFGTTGTAASLAPASASAVSIGSARLVIGGAALMAALPWLAGNRSQALSLWRTRWGVLAGLMTAVYQLAFFAAVARAGVALATLVTIGTGPILVGLLSWAILRERPTPAWWTSTAICVSGLVFVTIDGIGEPTVDALGLFFAVVAASGYAVYTVAAKRMMNAGSAPTEVMASAFGLGGLVLLPVLLLSQPSWIVEPAGLAVALWLGLATTTLAYVLFGRGLSQLPAGPAATLVLAEPLVATALGVGFLGERLGILGWVGAALVVLGLVLQGVWSIRGQTNVVEGALP